MNAYTGGKWKIMENDVVGKKNSKKCQIMSDGTKNMQAKLQFTLWKRALCLA